MTNNQIITDTLLGKKTNRVPIWLMRQAGRYLPEYRNIRSKMNGFLDMASTPNIASEITLQPIERFDFDAAIIFSDILVIPQALGQNLDFHDGIGPILGDIPMELKLDEEKLDCVYEAINLTRKHLSKDKALIGFAGAPWTIACYMLCGKSKDKEFMPARKFFWENPQQAEKLINTLIDSISIHLINQVKAGANVLQIFESWAGLSPSQKWIIEPTKEIVKRVRSVFPDIPIIGFPKGAGLLYENYVALTGVDAVSLDFSVKTKWAALHLKTPIQGNLDPACLLAGGDALERQTNKILQDFSGKNLIFNLGHGVHKETPPEHVEKLVQTVRSFSLA